MGKLQICEIGGVMVFTFGFVACGGDDDSAPAQSGAAGAAGSSVGGSGGQAAGAAGSAGGSGGASSGGAAGAAGSSAGGSTSASCDGWNFGNATCQSCMKTNCCDVTAACLASPDCTALQQCITTNMCTDATCLSMCNTKHMAGSADFQKVWQCAGTHCADPCSKP